jgi:hypothetical protein
MNRILFALVIALWGALAACKKQSISATNITPDSTQTNIDTNTVKAAEYQPYTDTFIGGMHRGYAHYKPVGDTIIQFYVYYFAKDSFRITSNVRYPHDENFNIFSLDLRFLINSNKLYTNNITSLKHLIFKQDSVLFSWEVQEGQANRGPLGGSIYHSMVAYGIKKPKF